MIWQTCECTGLNAEWAKMLIPSYAGCVGMSKHCFHENPYSVKGAIQHTGSEQAPKGICTDRFIGTWKAMNTNVKRVATQWCVEWKY